jgi:hypothetical protein
MAAKTRINITVDRDTLRLADREARRRRISRSEVFRSAVHAEAARKDASNQEQDLLRRRQEAIEGIRKMAREAGSWPTTKIIHDWRYRLAKEGH